MAVIACAKTDVSNSKSFVLAWTGLASGDTGAPGLFAQYTDRSVQVTGSFGGAVVALQGSNDGINWFTLTDGQGNALSFTGAGLKFVTEATAQVRPSVSGGAGVSVNVHAFIKE